MDTGTQAVSLQNAGGKEMLLEVEIILYPKPQIISSALAVCPNPKLPLAYTGLVRLVANSSVKPGGGKNISHLKVTSTCNGPPLSPPPKSPKGESENSFIFPIPKNIYTW